MKYKAAADNSVARVSILILNSSSPCMEPLEIFMSYAHPIYTKRTGYKDKK